MYERNPTPSAATLDITSQPTVTVEPTAAVAWVPMEPTIAVSIYCTAVSISSCSMVGQAREKTTGKRLRLSTGFEITGLPEDENIEKTPVYKEYFGIQKEMPK